MYLEGAWQSEVHNVGVHHPIHLKGAHEPGCQLLRLNLERDPSKTAKPFGLRDSIELEPCLPASGTAGTSASGWSNPVSTRSCSGAGSPHGWNRHLAFLIIEQRRLITKRSHEGRHSGSGSDQIVVCVFDSRQKQTPRRLGTGGDSSPTVHSTGTPWNRVVSTSPTV